MQNCRQNELKNNQSFYVINHTVGLICCGILIIDAYFYIKIKTPEVYYLFEKKRKTVKGKENHIFTKYNLHIQTFGEKRFRERYNSNYFYNVWDISIVI